MSTDPLVLQVTALADARAVAAERAAAVAAARADWEATHAVLLSNHAASKAIVAERETALREAVLAAFRATGDVAPAPGCKVVQRTVLDYAPPTALAWAKESGLALTLDVKAFEKIAKATPIPGVTVRQEPSVTVATDLDAALDATSPTPKE